MVLRTTLPMIIILVSVHVLHLRCKEIVQWGPWSSSPGDSFVPYFLVSYTEVGHSAGDNSLPVHGFPHKNGRVDTHTDTQRDIEVGRETVYVSWALCRTGRGGLPSEGRKRLMWLRK